MIVNYMTHVENIGWGDPVKNGETAGSTNQSLRMEGLKIWLTDLNGLNIAIEAQAHVESYGWAVWIYALLWYHL